MNIPALKDLTQEGPKGKRIDKIPEIRVWCHPHKINKSGSDYYYTFDSFSQALTFIKKHKEAEDSPLIAFRGWEINIFGIEGVNEPSKSTQKH